MDGGTAISGNTWYEQGQNPAAPTTGVPMGQQVTSLANPQFTYTTQPATSRNVMLLDNGGGNTTGRFTLVSPTALSQVAFLTSSGNGAGTVTATLHYSDGTSDASGLIFTAPDWFNGTPIAVNANGRISSAGYNNVNAGNPRLYDEFITNPNPGSPISSIDLSWTGSATTHTAIFAINAPVLNGDPAQTFTNNVSVTADSTVDVRSVAGGSLGNLAIGTNTLNITGLSGTSLALGAVNLSGSATLNTGTGLALSLGAINDGGTARSLTFAGTGTVNLGAAATSVVAGTAINVTGGTVNVNTANAIGSVAAVTLSPGATLNTSANLTIGSLAGGGGIVGLNSNTLTVSGGGSSSFGGAIFSGPLVVSGAGTVLTLSGQNTQTSTSVQPGAKLISTNPLALGSSPVTLANNSTLSLGAVQPFTVTGFGGSGTGWNLQGNGTSNPTVVGDALTITTAIGNIANSAWFGAKVPVVPFTATFRYSQSNPASPADGITFGFQNQSPTALGAPGGALGYQGITPSAAMTLNIYSGAGNQGPWFSVNGAAPAGYLDPTPVSLLAAQPGNEVTITVSYDGTNVAVHMVQGGNTYDVPTGSFTGNLASLVGSSAYLGFTGGTGGLNAQQVIDQFSYTVLSQSVYATPVTVADAAAATVNVIPTAATPTITQGTLTMGVGSTLNVGAEPGSPTNLAYGLTFGATTLNGATTFAVANNGTGTGTLTLGPVGGVGSLTKTGSGTLLLTDPGAYAGATTVSAGSLLAQGQGPSDSATGTGAISVAAGATLGGTGRFAPAANAGITVANGGRVFLDSNPTESLRLATAGSGSLTLGTATTPGTAAIIAFKLSSSGPTASANTGGSTLGTLPNPTNHGFLTTDGLVNLTAGLAFQIDGTSVSFTAGQPYSYQVGQLNGWTGGLMNFTNPASFSFIGTAASSASAQINPAGGMFVNFVPVPEPGSVLLVCGVAAGLGWWRRKRAG
jgi:fibronectin-binding autotransporter adhesin